MDYTNNNNDGDNELIGPEKNLPSLHKDFFYDVEDVFMPLIDLVK